MNFIFIPSDLDADAFEDGPTVTFKEGYYANILEHNKRKVEWADPKVESI